MAPAPHLLASRADSSLPPPESPYVALVIPAVVFMLLAICICLNRMVRRRAAEHGAAALELWPWNFLSACVGGGRHLRAHSWEPRAVAPPRSPPPARRFHLKPFPAKPPRAQQSVREMVENDDPWISKDLRISTRSASTRRSSASNRADEHRESMAAEISTPEPARLKSTVVSKTSHDGPRSAREVDGGQ